MFVREIVKNNIEGIKKKNAQSHYIAIIMVYISVYNFAEFLNF